MAVGRLKVGWETLSATFPGTCRELGTRLCVCVYVCVVIKDLAEPLGPRGPGSEKSQLPFGARVEPEPRA